MARNEDALLTLCTLDCSSNSRISAPLQSQSFISPLFPSQGGTLSLRRLPSTDAKDARKHDKTVQFSLYYAPQYFFFKKTTTNKQYFHFPLPCWTASSRAAKFTSFVKWKENMVPLPFSSALIIPGNAIKRPDFPTL